MNRCSSLLYGRWAGYFELLLYGAIGTARKFDMMWTLVGSKAQLSPGPTPCHRYHDVHAGRRLDISQRSATRRSSYVRRQTRAVRGLLPLLKIFRIGDRRSEIYMRPTASAGLIGNPSALAFRRPSASCSDLPLLGKEFSAAST